VTKFSGSIVIQTVLGGLAINHPVANFLQCVCAKNYKNWLRADSYCKEIFGQPHTEN